MTTLNPLTPLAPEADKTMSKLLNSLFLIKVLLAFYTVPHNATALAIIHPGQPIQYTLDTALRVLGLLVFEGAFLAMGYLISKGLIKGEKQGALAWVVYGMTITFMGCNSILATSLHQAHEYGYSISNLLTVYQAYVAPITAILIASSLSAIGYFHPPFELFRINSSHKTSEERIKMQLALAKATAEAEEEKIDLRVQIEQATDKATQLIAKNLADRERREADYTVELAKITADTKVKQAISDRTTAMINTYIASDRFARSVQKTVNKKVQEMIDRYNRVGNIVINPEEAPDLGN